MASISNSNKNNKLHPIAKELHDVTLAGSKLLKAVREQEVAPLIEELESLGVTRNHIAKKINRTPEFLSRNFSKVIDSEENNG
jgi:hypothetical protein